jgi:hypothetical protein
MEPPPVIHGSTEWRVELDAEQLLLNLAEEISSTPDKMFGEEAWGDMTKLCDEWNSKHRYVYYEPDLKVVVDYMGVSDAE